MKNQWRIFRRWPFQAQLQTITFYSKGTGNALYIIRWAEIRGVQFSPADRQATFHFQSGTYVTIDGIDTNALARDLSVYG